MNRHCDWHCIHKNKLWEILETPSRLKDKNKNPSALCILDETHWIDFNKKWSEEWPNIVHKGEVPDDASDWDTVPDKMKYFSEEPGDPGDD